MKNTIIIRSNHMTWKNHFFTDFENEVRAKCYETATLYERKEVEAMVAKARANPTYNDRMVTVRAYTFEKFCHAGINCEIRYREEPFDDWIGYVLLDKGHALYGAGYGDIPYDDIPKCPDVCMMDGKGRWNLGFDNAHLDQPKYQGRKDYIKADTESLAEFLANYKGENIMPKKIHETKWEMKWETDGKYEQKTLGNKTVRIQETMIPTPHIITYLAEDGTWKQRGGIVFGNKESIAEAEKFLKENK